MSDGDIPMVVLIAALVTGFSGVYHVADGVTMFIGGIGGSTLNILFATLSVILGVGLALSAAGLYSSGSGGWFLGASMLILFTLLLDAISVLLRSGLAAILDFVLLLFVLAVVVRRQSGEDSRADMDDDENVHSLLDYP